MIPFVELPAVAAAGANVVGAAVVHAATGWWAHRRPLARLQADGALLRLRGWEADGRWYERRLRITTWKDRVPEAGALFPGGWSKARLRDRSSAVLERHVVETRRAELGHWAALAGAPVFVVWNPPVGVVAMGIYLAVANLPCIAIQRYNRARLSRVLAARARRSRSA